MKIMFVNHAMHCGGTDNVVNKLINIFLNDKNIQCELVTFRSPDEDFFKIPSEVKRYSLGFDSDDSENSGLSYFSSSNAKMLFSLRKIIKDSNPDFIVTNWTSTNCFTLLASLFLAKKVICYEHIHFDSPSIVWRVLRRLLYPYAHKVLCLTESDQKKYQKFCTSIKTINPITLVKPKNIPAYEDRQKQFLAVGRLDPQKGFDNLLKAYSLIHHKCPEWKLKIIGEGKERASLEAQISELNLSSQVELLGAQNHVSKYYLQSKAFILSSRYEGFGLVILEAQVCGAAVISFDCKTGPSDIITNNYDGILVQDQSIEELARAMLDIAENDKLAKELIGNGLETSKSYDDLHILELWQSKIINE